MAAGVHFNLFAFIFIIDYLLSYLHGFHRVARDGIPILYGGFHTGSDRRVQLTLDAQGFFHITVKVREDFRQVALHRLCLSVGEGQDKCQCLRIAQYSQQTPSRVKVGRVLTASP